MRLVRICLFLAVSESKCENMSTKKGQKQEDPAGSSAEDISSDESRRNGRFLKERVTLELPNHAAVSMREFVFDGREEIFASWKWRIERRLVAKNLIHTLARTPEKENCAIPKQDPAAEKQRLAAFIERKKEDIEALDEIIMAINNDVLNCIVGVPYAKEAMDTLVKRYQRIGTYSWISMRDRLHNLKHRNWKSLACLFEEFDQIIRELDRMGANIPQDEKVHALIVAVPAELNHVKGALTVLPVAELCAKPLVEIKRMFLDAEVEMRIRDKPIGEPVRQTNIALKSAKKSGSNVCFGCGEAGHYKNRCPRKKQNGNALVARSGSRNLHVGGTSGRKRVRFIVDSGASQHMVRDESLLEDVERLNEPVVIATAKSGENLRATSRGKISLKSVVGKIIKPIILYNVLFIPGLEENLLSVRKSTRNGKRVTFLKDKVLFEFIRWGGYRQRIPGKRFVLCQFYTRCKNRSQSALGKPDEPRTIA